MATQAFAFIFPKSPSLYSADTLGTRVVSFWVQISPMSLSTGSVLVYVKSALLVLLQRGQLGNDPHAAFLGIKLTTNGRAGEKHKGFCPPCLGVKKCLGYALILASYDWYKRPPKAVASSSVIEIKTQAMVAHDVTPALPTRPAYLPATSPCHFCTRSSHVLCVRERLSTRFHGASY